MAQQTSIQWATASLNFFHGCRKVDDSCRNCYMFRQKETYGQDPLNIVRSKDPTFYMSKKLKDGDRVFVNSWSDFFIEEGDPWRDDAWAEIRKHPHLTYIILTKRVDRIMEHLPADWGSGYENVWLLTSCGDQFGFDKRVEKLFQVPARVRGISIEPLIEPLDLDVFAEFLLREPPSWVILGGESGDIGSAYDPRPFPVENAIEIVKLCKSSAVPVFMKQMGTVYAKAHGFRDDKGGDFELFPKELQVREFPGGGR